MLSKFYSMDECPDYDGVISYLEKLQDNDKLEFEVLSTDDGEVIELVDYSGLSQKEIKELNKFLQENDVIDYPDFIKDGYYEDDDSFDEGDDFDDFDEDDF